jgi:hypothetical protein
MSVPPIPAAERLTWVDAQAHKILRVDVRGLDREGMLALAEAYGKLMRPLPLSTVRMVTMHGDAEFHPDALTRARSIMLEVATRIERSALVGPEGMMKLSLERFYDTASLMGQDLRQRGRSYPEGDEARALQWLGEP